MSLFNVSSRGSRRRKARGQVSAWLGVWCGLAMVSCKTKLPDGVFVCMGDSDCPKAFTCHEGLCRRGSAAEFVTGSDGAVPPEPTGPDAASPDASLGMGEAGKRSPAAGSGGAGTGGSAPDAGENKVVPPPPPPPFMPHTFVPLPSGRSITASGASMQSSNYRLWTALGQAPGTGYPERSSSSYRLVGGIVGVLQSEQ